VVVESPPVPEHVSQEPVVPVFQRDKFLLRQKHLAISQKYYVWDEQENVLLFIQRPAHLLRNVGAILAGLAAGGVAAVVFVGVSTLFPENQTLSGIFIGIAVLAFFIATFTIGILLYKKRHVYFYRDELKQALLLEILQDKKVEFFVATYTLRDPQGTVLARFRKNYLYNIFRKRWYVYAPDGSMLCIAKEDSVLMSILRRLFGPLFGALRTNFIILQDDTEHQLGEFNRKFTLLDRYVLDMSADAAKILDRRIAVALGVLLDTGERR
jgi:hypothetical protein